MTDPLVEFERVLIAAGLLPGPIQASGKLVRCPVSSKPKGQDGAYLFHADPPQSGFWKNWRDGTEGRWTHKNGHSLSAQERERLKARIESDKKARQKEEAKRHAEAADTARRILEECGPFDVRHPYARRKNLVPLGENDIRVDGQGRLVVPVLDESGKLMTLQFISPDGEKRFLPGGRTKGGFFPFKAEADGPLLVCEGVATGSSLRMASDKYTVLCAFSAGNLKAVAEMARKKYPARKIIICADNDTETPGNPGLTNATDAARAVGGLVCWPEMDGKPCDFNDLHLAKGVKAIRARVEAAIRPEPGEAEKAKESGLDPGASSEPPTKPGLVAVDLAELLSMNLPERRMILDPIVPEQGLVMLYAPRGCGKTLAALTIACAVAEGGPALAWSAPEPRKVVFCDGEMPSRSLQERLERIVAGCGFEIPPGNLKIITPDLQPDIIPNLATRPGQDALEPLLADATLLVIDNISCLCSYGRENEAESWIPVQEWILRLRKQGLSVLLVHHAGKAGQQRGTSKREDVLDTVIALRRPEDYMSEQGARFEVHLEKARGIVGEAARPFEARLMDSGNGGGLVWAISPITDHDREMVAELLREGKTVRQIMNETGIARSTVGRWKKQIEGGRNR